MQVTIAMPSLNQGRFIADAIDSVLSQDYQHITLIVADGGSTDSTVDILRSYGDRILWSSGPDGGQASAINRVLTPCGDHIVHWLNSDDTLLPGAVSGAIEAFRTNPGAGVVYGDCLFTDESGAGLFITASKPFNYKHFVQNCRNPIPQPSAFIKREAWRELNADLTYFFDWDLWLWIGARWDIVHVPQVWSTYRIHPASKTGLAKYPAEELRSIYRRNFGEGRIPQSVYERMAEYYKASGKGWNTLQMRLMGLLFSAKNEYYF